MAAISGSRTSFRVTGLCKDPGAILRRTRPAVCVSLIDLRLQQPVSLAQRFPPKD
jgi:hypothetical protein